MLRRHIDWLTRHAVANSEADIDMVLAL